MRARYRPRTSSGREGKILFVPGHSFDRLLTKDIRYVQKFYQMRTQLQAVSLRIQTVRSNEQMMQSMKGATSLLGSMNRQMRLPALQKIAMEFERENDIMDQRQQMMDDAIDDVTGLEDEEEGEEVIKEVLDEIGIDLGQSVSSFSLTTLTLLWGSHGTDCGEARGNTNGVAKGESRRRESCTGYRGRWWRRRPIRR